MPPTQPATGTLSIEELERRAQLSQMVAIGFFDAQKSLRWLDAPELKKIDREKLFEGLRYSPSPDSALISLVRLLEKAPQLEKTLNAEQTPLAIYRLLGASEALGDFLLRHPEHLDVLTSPQEHLLEEPCPPTLLPEKDHEHLCPQAPLDTQYRRSLLKALGANPEDENPTAQSYDKNAYITLRTLYRRYLCEIAVCDLAADNPQKIMPLVSRKLADLASAALDGALAIARAEANTKWGENNTQQVQLSIIGMGKCGARELNYISDVDVMYVVDTKTLPESETPLTDEQVSRIASEIVQTISKVIMSPASEPALWELDPNLRPEGKDGALVRTIDSYTSYYQRWAENWEFQALLKARPIAGNADLGYRWMQKITGFIWESSNREGFVSSVQKMRARVTENIPAQHRERQLKLGPGGLRDIEFTVQLLQLVHGRFTPSVRTQATTDSLQALSKASFIGRADAQSFEEHYQKIRLMEHRLQLRYMRRTHLMPEKDEDIRVLARAITSPEHIGEQTAQGLIKDWTKTKRAIRSLHERLFFRPLLAAVSHLSQSEVALTPEEAQARLGALGYKDTRTAMRHIQALTQGIKRSAEIQRTLMPVLLGWLAQGVDPDAGLLGFRRLSESLGTTPWYLRMLRDSPAAAERVCQILSSSRFITDLLEDAPESIAWLDHQEDLLPRSVEALQEVLHNSLIRHEDTADAIRSVRMIRRREILRIAMGEAINFLSLEQTMQALTTIDQVTVEAALNIVLRERYTRTQQEPKTQVCIIAMGRHGGFEIGYGSDVDVMYVHEPCEGIDESVAASEATEIIHRMVQILKQPCTPPLRAEKILDIDANLRPEGKSGPMVRSLASFREYYERWADTWEHQALLRARPFAGSKALGEKFMNLIALYRYPATLTMQQVMDIRRIKARVENERMPQGADRNRQLKLGRGSLSDVEWLIQMIQLCCASKIPTLQVTSTLQALEQAKIAGLLKESDARILSRAWKLATKIRGCQMLRTGRPSDVLTSTRIDLEAIARWCAYPSGHTRELEEDYLRATRQARQVFERLFFDTDFRQL
ncbi:bifunctional [glutamine synthetase] adenylyltransferase/[glutamine synthetase]-adenylyl-L-tyrosine phosphorylase [Rothia sp. CCM 9418]|uniref:bifunctional [glutamine synthetase] adenylyltransferase/[glutamine synthetase]-adenylyl-L-tyrosine phosphorylase n=1 Tax=Rothia sp. CCM 9418 TaxID=3402661 RepID=UPI003ADCEA8C